MFRLFLAAHQLSHSVLFCSTEMTDAGTKSGHQRFPPGFVARLNLVMVNGWFSPHGFTASHVGDGGRGGGGSDGGGSRGGGGGSDDRHA